MVEWLTLTIRKRAKNHIRYPETDKPCDINMVANHIYDGLVEDWTYNKNVLEACRALKVNRATIVGIISDLFDENGKPIPLKQNAYGMDEAKTESVPQAGAPYYASMSTLDEEFDLKKSQVKGFTRTRRGKMERVQPFERGRKIGPRGGGFTRDTVLLPNIIAESVLDAHGLDREQNKKFVSQFSSKLKGLYRDNPRVRRILTRQSNEGRDYAYKLAEKMLKEPKKDKVYMVSVDGKYRNMTSGQLKKYKQLASTRFVTRGGPEDTGIPKRYGTAEDNPGKALLKIVGEAKDTQAKFLKTKGTTIEEARKLPKEAQDKLQAEYSTWLKKQE